MPLFSFRKRNYNIVFDTMIGLLVNILLILYIENPGDYIINASNVRKYIHKFNFLNS